MKLLPLITCIVLLIGISCTSPEQEVIKNDTLTSEQKLAKKMVPYEEEYIKMYGGVPSKGQIAMYQKSMALEKSKSIQKSDVYGGDWTLQGPGNIGGRVNAIATETDNSNVIYAGFARGGLWKTIDGGDNWISLWDDAPSQAVSAIAIDPQNSQVVYAGTGDVNVSGNVFVGEGLYRSENGGDSWSYIGLDNTYIIGDIIIDPVDSDRILVAAMGFPFEPDNNRGVYLTEDGGQTWNHTLFVSNNTGVHDLAFHPQKPNVVLAASWTRTRNQLESKISGPDCNVYISNDFGQNWSLVELDIPDEKGRPAVCFSETNPNIAYAMFTSTDSYFQSLHKTTDGGLTWEKIDEKDDETPIMMGGFSWFFGRIESLIDPTTSQEKLYLCGVDLWSYDEGIDEWFMETPPWWEYSVHADKHAIVKSSDGSILLGTDGGLYSFGNSGSTWEDIENIPNNMFYRVEYNPHQPDLYYGGMQDNGTSSGNVESMNDWIRIYGGDGFQPRFHPVNDDEMYAETQNGAIHYYSDEIGYFLYVDLDSFNFDRSAWDMQYILSPHDPSVIYLGTYRGVKVTNNSGAFNVEPLTGELTDEPEYIQHVVSALDESILEEGLLYFGTTDGNLWRLENGTEVSISNGLPDLYVTSVKASPHNVDYVYVTFSGYMLNDNKARIFRSKDRGETWEDISSGLPLGAVNDIVIYDEHQDSVLFAATNAGVYASIDAGQVWSRLGETLPIIPVNDMCINIEKNQLVAGTYGRSINTYPIDSILAKFNNVISFNNEVASLEFTVYPNPATNFISIEGDNITRLEVYSANGKLVMSSKYRSGEPLDVSELGQGIYYVQVTNKEGAKGVQSFTKVE